MTRPARLFRVIWWAAGLSLLLAAGRDRVLGLIPQPRELPREDRATGRPWISGDFTNKIDYQEIADGRLPAYLPRASSWQHNDAWQGGAESAWFRASTAVIHVGVAGYPRHHGCAITAEFKDAAGHVTRVPFPLRDPGERWQVWEINRPAGAVAVRVVAEDRTSDFTGWVAFSHPFRAWPSVLPIIWEHLQLYTTVALALTLVWGPGLFWYPRGTAPAVRLFFLIGIGPLILAGIGVLVWSLGGLISPTLFSGGTTLALWLAIGLRARPRGVSDEITPTLRVALGVSALMVVAVTAKSTYSTGPSGELYRGTISRNLTIGDRMDSRFPFFIVQAAAHHSGPAAPTTERYFQPWTFFSRGPLAGLATIPVVLATGGKPPKAPPNQTWHPFDPQGFAAYRVTMMTLASSIIVALAGMLSLWIAPRWALAGAGLLALSPFGVHEIMFTWPKWVATTWLVLSFSLAHTRRPFAAGLTLGVGFLFHPMVLLWSPWLGLWACGRAPRDIFSIGKTGLRIAGGAVLLVIPWMLAGALTPHLPDTVMAGQGGFFRYWLEANRQIATWTTWWHSRWLNFANTFIPLHVYLSSESFHHAYANSVYEPSGRLVKFAYVWWNTLPFGLGLGLWLTSLTTLVTRGRNRPAVVWLLLVGPALLITANWGWDPLGLMRECGHPLFVAVIAITCVLSAEPDAPPAPLLDHRAVPWLQLPETLLMLWLTTLAQSQPWQVDYAQLDFLCLLINTLALLTAAWVLFRQRTRTIP